MVYIDGGHSYEVVQSDLKNYAPMVKPGGYLIVDDCCHKYNLPPGYFPGIESVSKAVDEVLPNEQFKELFSVVHNRVFQRVY
jgi:cephalosporin hydroxylase